MNKIFVVIIIILVLLKLINSSHFCLFAFKMGRKKDKHKINVHVPHWVAAQNMWTLLCFKTLKHLENVARFTGLNKT